MPNKLVKIDHDLVKAAGKTAGWTPGADGHYFGGAKFGYVDHVMWVNDEGKFQYDQMVRFERGGAVFLPVDTENRIGLQKSWRPQTRDQDQFARDYPRVDFGNLGRESWELLGGFSDADESALKTARREAQEESGSQVTFLEDLGLVCDNRAFSLHLVRASWGRIDSSKKAANKPDPHEKKLSALTYFTLNEVVKLQEEGKLYDGFTLSAITLLMLKHPEIFTKALVVRELLR
ncbi:MAG: NUDIX domain-containing protein [bacterium]